MLSTDIAAVFDRNNRGSFPATRTMDIPGREQSRRTAKRKQTYPARQPQAVKAAVIARQQTGALISDNGASKRTPVFCPRVAAAIDPHRLATLAWAMVAHAGSTPGRCGGLAAFAAMCLRQAAAVVDSLLRHCWRRE